MNQSWMSSRTRSCVWPAALLLMVLVTALGCESREEIRHYRAAKVVLETDAGDTTDATDRMLAAIVLKDDTAWFFKLMGPKDEVQEQAEGFRELIESLKFVGGKPKWSAPDTWVERPAAGLRFATILVDPKNPDLELTVISLPNPAGADSRDYQLANVNRWRGQLGLEPMSLAALEKESEQIKFEGGTALMVNLLGTSGGTGGMGRPPFAGTPRPPRDNTPPPAESSALKFDKPDGWEEGELVVSRGGITLRHEAAFTAADGEQEVEVTVDRLPLARPALANVNRWRQQVGLSPLDEAAYRESAEQIELAGEPADYVQLVGEQETVLGVIAQRDGQAWFIKLKGENELAASERERFEKFVRSIRFE